MKKVFGFRKISNATLIIILLVLSMGTWQTVKAAQTRILRFPGNGTWYVCQGYWGPISHGSGNMVYSLDLSTSSSSFSGSTGCSTATSNSSTGKVIYAPATGTATLSGADLLWLKLDSGGCLLIGHLANRVSGTVKQGAQIGVVSGPNSANGNYAHLHLSAFSSTCGSNPVSFSENNNFRFYGNIDMPNSTTKLVNQYRGKALNGVLVPPSCTVPTGQFCGAYYNNRYLSGNPQFTRNEGSVNFNWGTGSPGSGVATDNFSVRWQGKFYFDSATYTFTATADDGIRVYVDNVLQMDYWRDQAPTTYKKDIALTAGYHTVKVEYYENGGGAVAQTSWVRKTSGNLAYGKSASATSQESSSYPPYKANDGSTSTRWSSALSSTLGTQWWIVDLGTSQSINQFVVRWEAAYARDYFIGYSNPPAGTSCWSVSYSGFNRYPTSAQVDTISFATTTARCVGIYMRQRAPYMNNYSIYEVEVYRR